MSNNDSKTEEKASRASKVYRVKFSQENKYIYYVLGKTGSRTILNWLHENAMYDPKPKNFARDTHAPKLDYFRFAFVRNPWDRLVSYFFNKIHNDPAITSDNFDTQKMRFKQMVNILHHDLAERRLHEIHVGTQTGLLPVADLSFIGRFENFDNDFNYVKSQILKNNFNPEKEKKIAICNQTSDKRHHYSKYYDEETKQIVHEMYGPDIEFFKYSFDQK